MKKAQFLMTFTVNRLITHCFMNTDPEAMFAIEDKDRVENKTKSFTYYDMPRMSSSDPQIMAVVPKFRTLFEPEHWTCFDFIMESARDRPFQIFKETATGKFFIVDEFLIKEGRVTVKTNHKTSTKFLKAGSMNKRVVYQMTADDYLTIKQYMPNLKLKIK